MDIIKKVENHAKTFKARELRSPNDLKRHDRIRRDEQRWMWVAHNKLGWSPAKIGSVFDRGPRTVTLSLKEFKRMEERKVRKPVSKLVFEICSSLYEEVSMMYENIFEFKNCNSPRYGRPDYSATLPADKVPGGVRGSLIRAGKYGLVSENLRQSLDNYYNKAYSDWNPLLDIWNLLRDLKEGRIRDIEVVDEGRKVVIYNSDGCQKESWSLAGKPIYARYRDIKGLDLSEIKGNLEAMRQDLDKLAQGLLKDLQVIILSV